MASSSLATPSVPRRSTAEDLAKAEPAVEAAMAALDSLDPKSLTECKGMIKPPGGVDDVFAASMVLLAGIYPNIQHKKLKVKDRSWDAAKKQCLGNIKEYIESRVGVRFSDGHEFTS